MERALLPHHAGLIEGSSISRDVALARGYWSAELKRIPPFGWMGPGPASEHHNTMALSDLLALTVPAAPDATLSLWVTNPLLRESLTLMEAWRFTYKTNLVWVKR